MHWKGHEINLNCSGPYIDFLDWIKNEKATIKHINKDDNKWCENSKILALNHKEIGRYSQMARKLNCFGDKYN